MYQNEFLIPEGIYLQSHSLGCLPQVTKSAETDYFDIWQQLGSDAWSTWLSMTEDFNIELAKLFNANAADFCPQNNVSSALTKIIFSTNSSQNSLQQKKNTLLLSNDDFPSLGFVFSKAQNNRYKLHFIPGDCDITSLDHWKLQITDETQLMLITHVTSDFSKRAPVAEIIQLAKQKNIITVVDIAQSAGIVPIDFLKWDADFVIGSCIKWLCGGPGAGFLWANPKTVNNFSPQDVGWFSHKNPFEFDIHHFEYASDAKRFWGGTPSVLPFIIAARSIKCINKIGIDKITSSNQQLVNILLAAAQESKIKIMSPVETNKRGGTITLKFKNVTKTKKLLIKNKVFFDVRRENCFRFSPHIYNGESEVIAVTKLFENLK